MKETPFPLTVWQMMMLGLSVSNGDVPVRDALRINPNHKPIEDDEYEYRSPSNFTLFFIA
ncbi:MAG: hypothetical protein Q8P27_01495 [Candidatus Peregrinibacteria bacterium]|nr:hypothetical protein [Candidatus Peregrinibacteria bacterium]